jgi:hypothetical protein
LHNAQLDKDPGLAAPVAEVAEQLQRPGQGSGGSRVIPGQLLTDAQLVQDPGFALPVAACARGGQYCKASAAELAIDDCFVNFLPKPNVYIDDQPVHEWKSCKHLYPSQVENA